MVQQRAPRQRRDIGLGTTAADIDRLTGALHELAAAGPRYDYRRLPEHDEYEPVGRPTGQRAAAFRS